MTISFTINKSRERLKKQWKYLAKRGMRSLKNFKKVLRLLIVATIIYLVFYFFTAADNFVVLKELVAYLIFNIWILMALFSLFLFFMNFRNNRQLNKFLNSISSDQLIYDIEINDEHVKIISGRNAVELPWSEFVYYGIHNNTVYVFNKVKALNSLYWDNDEMGNDNYSALIELLKQKSIEQKF